MGWTPSLHVDHQRGDYYARVGGRKHRLGRNKRAAQRRLVRLIAIAVPLRGEPVFVADGIARWRQARQASSVQSREWESTIVDAWGSFAGHLLISEIPGDHLEKYAAHLRRLKRRQSPKTIKTKMTYAMRVCKWFVDQGWLLKAPAVPELVKPPRIPRDVPQNRLPDIFERLPRRAGAVLRFVLETGCRPGEACSLTWGQVNLEDGTALLQEHKTIGTTGRARVIYLSPSAVSTFGTRQPDSRHVFLSRLGKPYTPAGLRSILRRYAPGVTPYALRHTFAQNALDQTSMEDVAALLGHSDLRTVQVYAQVRDNRLRKVASTLSSPLQPDRARDHDAKIDAAAGRQTASPPPPRKRATARGA